MTNNKLIFMAVIPAQVYAGKPEASKKSTNHSVTHSTINHWNRTLYID